MVFRTSTFTTFFYRYPIIKNKLFRKKYNYFSIIHDYVCLMMVEIFSYEEELIIINLQDRKILRSSEF